MRFHHFFIEQKIIEGSIGHELTVPDPSLAHQLRNVFRFQQGDAGDYVILLDNSGFQSLARIVSLDKEAVVFHIEERQANDNKPPVKLVLYQSLVKKDTFEWIVEKATELGVEMIVPVLSERSEKKSLNVDRCQKIMKEASEQSGRAFLPTICETRTLAAALNKIQEENTSEKIFTIAFDPKGLPLDGMFHKRQEWASSSSRVAIFIGPEGGWSESELALMRQKGVHIFSLGTQILRAETAAVAVLALAMFSRFSRN